MSRQFIPHDNQREALRFLHSRRRAGLWMPMGGGKADELYGLIDDFEED